MAFGTLDNKLSTARFWNVAHAEDMISLPVSHGNVKVQLQIEQAFDGQAKSSSMWELSS